MKKLFFTAIAVLAFSGSGFAETKEVNIKAFRNCSAIAAIITSALEDNGDGGCWTSNYYNSVYNQLLVQCSKT